MGGNIFCKQDRPSWGAPGSRSSGWQTWRKSRMYELIKKQIAADYFQQRFPNDGQRFVAWYLRNILFRDMNETSDDITDGGDDKQIDAIVNDDDKTLVRIIQGKFIQSGTIDAEPLREVLSAWIQIKDLARLQNVANHKRTWQITNYSASSRS